MAASRVAFEHNNLQLHNVLAAKVDAWGDDGLWSEGLAGVSQEFDAAGPVARRYRASTRLTGSSIGHPFIRPM